MKRKNYLICLLTAIILLPIGVQAKDKKKGKKNIPMTEIQTTGTQDRAIWVKLLWKISYPVIHNLAEGTLHQNMPIETRSGETAGYKDMTHLEAVGRTLAGVAPWLALPDDDTEEGKLRKQMREEVLKGLKNAVDPASPDLLNFTKHAQPIVAPATITRVERKKTLQQSPLLYDLTALQKDCNVHYDLTADKTLSIAQSLYEKKLISYPRTGSRHIPEDVMRHIPSLLEKAAVLPEFREYGQSFDFSDLNTRSVDDTKVTDHHALIITGIVPEGLSGAESTVYTLIAGRMLESFSPPCEKELLVMECTCEGMEFRSRSSCITKPGWRGVFARMEDREKDEPERDHGTAEFAEGEAVPVMGHGLAQKKTLPKPLYTEATLLAAMETCGKNITDEQAKEAIRDLGIGTPATRAAIITTLIKRDYIARSGKSIIPTEKGMYIHEAVKGMRVADVELTGSWEKALLQIEGHTLDTETFMKSIRDYTSKATGEILRLDFPAMQEKAFTCPKCKTGKIILRSKVAKCDRDGCGLLVFRRVLNKELTDSHLEQLFSSGSTKLIKGFKGKKGVPFDAAVTFDAEYNPVFSFPKTGNGKRK